MPRTYAEIYQGIAQAGTNSEARQLAIQELLAFVRTEIESPRSARDRIKTDLEVLQGHGTIDDIRRIDAVIARRSLDDVTLEFAHEVKRQLQERFYLLSEISEEEEEVLRTGKLTPKDPKSEWLAIRRGVIVAEARERTEVEAEVTRKQRARPTYVALVVPVGGALRNSHERR